MFECKRCGRCCIHSIPEFEKDEYERVKYIASQMGIEFVNIKIKGIEVYYTSKNFTALSKFMAGTFDNFAANGEPIFNCEFLKLENGISHCAIYDLRPTVCREFALVKDPLRQCLNPENQR